MISLSVQPCNTNSISASISIGAAFLDICASCIRLIYNWYKNHIGATLGIRKLYKIGRQSGGNKTSIRITRI